MVHENIISTQKDSVTKETAFVENKTQIMQHILKIQLISFV
jgi:hypothetical protein